MRTHLSRWKALFAAVPVVALLACNQGRDEGAGSESEKETVSAGSSVVLQLNWLHDPTFAGEYMSTSLGPISIDVREGGPNVSPSAEVLSGRADIAVVGADIFLQTLAESLAEGRETLTCFFVDFQRNPVGWILHPDAAEAVGFDAALVGRPVELNKWLFRKFAEGALKPGDKRGTETTAIWTRWRAHHQLPDEVSVVPVGFDTSVVLGAPKLAYPVYFNEEPFKLTAKIGREVVVFDPSADGIELYGNVLVARTSFVRDNPELVRALRKQLAASWNDVRAEREVAVARVAEVYTGVGLDVLRKQVDKTVEFVFFEVESPGLLNVARWGTTLKALQTVELVPDSLSVQVLEKYLVLE